MALNVLWLQSGGCGGCSMSLLCADTTDFQGHLRDAGVLYSVGLRSMVWVTPFLAGMVWHIAGVFVALLVLFALYLADRG